MTRLKAIIVLSTLFIGISDTFSQSGEWPIEIFGYFQNEFQYQTARTDEPEQKSFSLQQLNLFFQKDFARNWTSFINFEMLNNFSSSRQWGAFNLEEAWIRYRSSEKFNLKLGLLIPIFNNLNEIKNRTPLLPYIIRPLVYETSLSETIGVEEFVPSRAFVQTYGFIPIGEAKLDYALYVGNSPNINNRSDDGQTGIDTTATFLIGGRVGGRFKELKVGFSATRDNVNHFQGVERLLGGPPSRFKEVPRIRLGGDLSYNVGKFSFEGEFIAVIYHEDTPELDLNREFYYGTLGYHITETLFAYGSYWVTKEGFSIVTANDLLISVVNGNVDIHVPTVGIASYLNDRITLKGQLAPVEIKYNHSDIFDNDKFNFYSIAISVVF